jgi:hypothetical protein
MVLLEEDVLTALLSLLFKKKERIDYYSNASLGVI